MTQQSFCPCCSGLDYANCCEPYLTGATIVPTAEALMRSRYTAYGKGNVDYLIATLHPKSRQKDDWRILRQSTQRTHWVGLTIVKTQKGKAQDKQGMVEFVALFRDAQAQGFQATEPEQLHERSRFVKEEGQWFYVDGDMLPPIRLTKKPI